MRRLRLDMLAGRRNALCSRCYRLEDAGVESRRLVHNRLLSQYWDLLRATSRDGSADPDKVVSLDLRFSNVCNLKCRTCGPWASTAWYREDPAHSPGTCV